MATVSVAEAIKDLVEAVGPRKRNRIMVSTKKKPLFFYVNLAKRYMQFHNEIVLSALGMAIGTVVTVSEILKNNGLATENHILTSTIITKDETKGRLVWKSKMEILLGKTEKFDAMVAAKAEKNGNGNGAKGKANGVDDNGAKGKADDVDNGVKGKANGVDDNGAKGKADDVDNGVKGKANDVDNGAKGKANGAKGEANGAKGKADGVDNGAKGKAEGVDNGAKTDAGSKVAEEVKN